MGLIALFSADQIVRRDRYAPLDRIDEDTAQALVEKGLAEWRSYRGFVIQLRRTIRKWDKRGISCSPRVVTMEAAADGDPVAAAIIASRRWAPIVNVLSVPA